MYMIVFALFAGRNHHGMLIKNRKAKLGVLFYSLRLSPSNTHTFHFRLGTIRYAGQTPRELVVIKCFHVTTLKWSLKERNEVFITGSPLLNYKATQTQSFFNTWPSYLETSRGLQNISKKWKGLKKFAVQFFLHAKQTAVLFPKEHYPANMHKKIFMLVFRLFIFLCHVYLFTLPWKWCYKLRNVKTSMLQTSKRFCFRELWEVLFSVKREADRPSTTQLIADRDTKSRIKYQIVYTENCS